MFIFELHSMLNPKYVINFPTKRDWRQKSLYEDVESGLKALVADVQRLRISSIAVPPLGCGLGGLNWRKVRPMIETAFAQSPNVRVMLFEPVGAPEAQHPAIPEDKSPGCSRGFPFSCDFNPPLAIRSRHFRETRHCGCAPEI